MSLELPPQPFVGLRPFDRSDSPLFFGRGQQVIALLQRLHRSHFLAIVGASGSGKSSLVRAGLIPKLEAGFLVEDRDRWTVATMKPGTAALHRLAEAITDMGDEKPTSEEIDRLATDIRRSGVAAILKELKARNPEGDENTLFLLDQFEEVFRFGEGYPQAKVSPEAMDVVSLMLALASQRQVPVYVTLTMRSDFLGNCDAFAGLPEAMNESQYLVPRLTREQLREAMLGPIRLFGASMAPQLVDRLLNDAGDTSDGLPVLQHALLRTWSFWKRSDGTGEIDLDSYEAVGTVTHALARHAEEALKDKDGLDLDASEIDRIRRLFQALTDVDSANRFVRRPAKIGELAKTCGASEPQIREIIKRFQDDHRAFLTTSYGASWSDDLVDISHESLIRQWAALRKWVEEEAESAEIYRRLAKTAALHGAGDAALYRSPDLDMALAWKVKQQPTPDWGKRYHDGFRQALEFLRVSEEEDKALRRREKELPAVALRRTRRFAAALAALVMIAGIAAAWAIAVQVRLRQQTSILLTEQKRVNATLDQAVQALRKQLGSEDTALVVKGVDQLVRIHHKSVEDIVSWLPSENLKQNQWLASFALALDFHEATVRDANGGGWENEMRVTLPKAVSHVRSIRVPPGPEEDDQLNRRILIPGGSFLMGNPSAVEAEPEHPAHRVTLSPFLIQEHEVTNEEYRRFDRAHDASAPKDLPVVSVLWADAMAYGFWIGGNLPTEAQWEFAARGVRGRQYPWGDAPTPTCDRAQFRSCSGDVKAVKNGREAGKTPEGIYDLAGNVWEWCRDLAGAYQAEEQTDPLGPPSGQSLRVLRGGSFDSRVNLLRAASRNEGYTGSRFGGVGFRLVSRLRP